MKPFARTLIDRDDLRTEATAFKIKGFDPQLGRTDLLDLLHDKLISNKQVLRIDGRSTAVDSASAFASIEDAYRELKDDLEVAAGLRT